MAPLPPHSLTGHAACDRACFLQMFQITLSTSGQLGKLRHLVWVTITWDSLPQCRATEPNNVGSSRELFQALLSRVTFAVQ